MVEILPHALERAMSQTPLYTEYHPRWYRTRVSTYWWMRRRTYFAFILRELSSLFVVWFVVFTLLQIRALSQGAEGYQQFLAFARNPVVIVVNLIALFFVVFHAITWFNLAPKAMVVRLRGKRLPSAYIAAPNYIAWMAASALVAWIILRG
jgi:fumarate reductase subunit C